MRRALACAALLGTVTACTSTPLDPPGRQLAPAAEVGVQVVGTLLPHRSMVLAAAPADAARLPGGRNCSAVLSTLLRDGGAVADAGRLEITIRATRRVQVRIDQVTARAVTEPAPRFATWARCGTSDWRERNTADGERYGAQRDITIKDVSHDVPWITGPGLLSQVEYDGYFQGPPYLADTPLDLGPDVAQTLPMYLAGTDPALRQGFLINVYLTVNGKQYAVAVTDAGGSPFWIHSTAATGQARPAVEFLEDTGRWVPGRVFDQAEQAERAVPPGRACAALRPADLAPLLGGKVWVDGGDDTCSWTDPDSDRSLRLVLNRAESEADAVEQFRNRLAALPTTYPDDRLIHVPDVGSEAVNINSFVLTHAGREAAEFTMSGDGPIDPGYLAAVQAASRRLWPEASASTGGRIAPYTGEWRVHGATLTVRPDGTAEETWNAGPCSDDLNDMRMCSGRATIDLRARSHFAIATTTGVSYQDDQGRPAVGFAAGPGSPAAGDTVYLHLVQDNVLLRLGDLDGTEGNPYLCAPDVTDDFWTTRCGG